MTSSSPESHQLSGSRFESGPPYTLPPLRPSQRPSERDKRTYRACLHCRQRKSRCDLYGSGEPGKPPCERCIREQHECVLGGSRRGGKRVKRTHSATPSDRNSSATPIHASAPRSIPPQLPAEPLANAKTGVDHPPFWPILTQNAQVTRSVSQDPPPAPDNGESESSSAKMTVHESIASADIQNTSDALEFLANVADRAEGQMLPPIRTSMFSQSPSQQSSTLQGHTSTPASSVRQLSESNSVNFAPLQKGHLNMGLMHELLARYERNYHPFFPLANPAALDIRKLPSIATDEPHLLAAICTIASKDEGVWWNVHEACSAHMQELIATLVYGGGGSVEAVEALLILAEWVPRRPQSTPSIGKGEEDHQAWMLVGTAVRIGYLLGLDRTGFRNESDPNSPEFNRKRLAWSACYMMDRHVSVRIGKAFWSRGPGPMTGLNARDFPSLRARTSVTDDYAAIWEANMELTQLFSNAHDVLYSSKNRSAQLNSGGEYVKYIDDFRTATRAWHNTWGMLTCSPPLKASLVLSYEYLRLYINAFAYQATINRMVVQANEYANNPSSAARCNTSTSITAPFTDFMAVTPDARFIYDSVDAAKCLLNTFNSFVDPVTTFRFMPLRYYLYVIYSACFLYKARSTGVLGTDRSSVKRMINDTVERLEKASACSNDVGDRYSKLIRLLWRKPPSQEAVVTRAAARASTVNDMDHGRGDQISGPNAAAADHGPTDQIGYVSHQQQQQQQHQHQHQNQHQHTVAAAAAAAAAAIPLYSINTFSWLDLQGVENFATNNNSAPGSLMESMDSFEDGPDGMFAPSHFGPGFTMPQHQQQQQQAESGGGGGGGQQQQQSQMTSWNGMPTNPGIIF